MFSTHLNLILHSESSFLSTTLVTHYNLCTPVLATFASQNIISDCRSQDSDADENLSDTDGVLTDWSLDSDMDDQVLLMDRGECTCPNPKAHKRDCPLSIRSRGKRLFPSFKPGNKVAIHVQKFPGKHLVCRIAQVTNKRYTLCCKRGTLFQRFGESDLQHLSTDEKHDIPLDKWRQGEVVSVKALCCEDLMSCSCNIDVPDYQYVKDDREEPSTQASDGREIETPIYSLSSADISTIDTPTGWLNDKVITASQNLLLQHFPSIEGLQPPTLQQVRGFRVQRSEFVQVLNVHNRHWYVVSSIGCVPGQVKVYDTMYRKVQETTIPIIASLVYSSLPTLIIHMMDVGPQSNGHDCGVLAIAIAYDLCAGNNPLTVVYEHKTIRQHLLEGLRDCCFSRFPTRKHRTSKGVIHSKEVSLYCSCRMPEEEIDNDPMAQCDSCSEWYHRSCQAIPNKVFEDDDAHWTCQACKGQK